MVDVLYQLLMVAMTDQLLAVALVLVVQDLYELVVSNRNSIKISPWYHPLHCQIKIGMWLLWDGL